MPNNLPLPTVVQQASSGVGRSLDVLGFIIVFVYWLWQSIVVKSATA